MRDILVMDRLISADLALGKGAIKIDRLRETIYAGEATVSQSVLSVAIEIDGEVLGTLALYHKKSINVPASRQFSVPDRDMLQNFGMQVSKRLKRFFPLPAPAPFPVEPVLADQ